MHLEGEVEATETEARHHPLGLTRLVGELFKLKMLKDSQRLPRALVQAAAHLWEATGWTSTSSTHFYLQEGEVSHRCWKDPDCWEPPSAMGRSS